VKDFFAPFRNASVFHILNWHYNGSNLKSLSQLNTLVEDVILQPNFKQEDFISFSASREAEHLDNYTDNPESPFSPKDGWIKTSVSISIPADNVKHSSVNAAPKYEVPGLFYHPLIKIIKSSFQEPAAEHFNLFPFKEYWVSETDPTGKKEQLYSEVYTADTFIEEHKRIQAQPCEPGCNLETIVVAIMCYSDSMHLTSFGNAALWPIYEWFGNQSKYPQGKPTSFAAQHVAYIPKVSWVLEWCLKSYLTIIIQLGDAFQDWYIKTFRKLVTAEVITHCHRELVQAIWHILLGVEFMVAYCHRIVMECADGIMQHFFPCFFFYRADYPEKCAPSFFFDVCAYDSIL